MKEVLWRADLGDGRYRNPILYTDYSDPDVIRVGDTYYLTASSFQYTPGLLYYCDPDGHSTYVQDQNRLPVDERTPRVGTITIRRVECYDADASAVCVYGLPEQPVEKIELEDVGVSFLPRTRRKAQCPLMMDGLSPMTGKSFFLKNVEEVSLRRVRIAAADDAEPELSGVTAFRAEKLKYLKRRKTAPAQEK